MYYWLCEGGKYVYFHRHNSKIVPQGMNINIANSEETSTRDCTVSTIQDLTCRNFGPRERKKRTLKPSVVQYATPADKYSAYLTVSDRLLL